MHLIYSLALAHKQKKKKKKANQQTGDETSWIKCSEITQMFNREAFGGFVGDAH